MIVFVHGVPETGAVWDGVRKHLERESVAVSLPGFGISRPAGFSSTKDGYVDWLVARLDEFAQPVDLVGHDWGALLTYRVATAFGDRLRSWTADVANTVHPDYVWHQFAQMWQTPGEGEQFFASQLAQPVDARASALEALGVPADDARAMAGWADPEMAASILALYRSATPNVFRDWGDRFAATSAPGMAFDVTDDPFDDDDMAAEVAQLLGARLEPFAGVGHFWMLEAPDVAAKRLQAFWDSVGP